MAGESKQPVDGEVENGLNEEESESNYACCVKKPCKVTVCRNCGKVFHISCAKRILGGEIKGTLTECCDLEEKKVGEANQPSEKWQEKAEIEKLTMEVDLLKRLIKEVFEKNEILRQNNDLLLYKIDSLVKNNAEEKSRYQDRDKGTGATQPEGQQGQRDVSRSSANENGNGVPVQQRRKREMTDKVDDVGNNDGQWPTSNHRPQEKNGGQIHQRDHGGREREYEQHDNRQEIGSRSQRYRKHAPKSGENTEPDVTGDVDNIDRNDWQEVRSNRSRFRGGRQKSLSENTFTKNNSNPHRHRGQEKVVGEAGEQAENGFTGVEKKVWLYVDKVSKHVTAEDVAEYVKKRPGFEGEDVRVKNLSKENNVGNSFVVVAPFKKKAELYDAKFWPSNIVVRRFNFRRYHDENDSHFLVL